MCGKIYLLQFFRPVMLFRGCFHSRIPVTPVKEEGLVSNGGQLPKTFLSLMVAFKF